MKTIFDIPEEILILIFRKLSSRDKVALSKSFKYFDNVLHVPELLRSLDFTAAYDITFSRFHWFLNEDRCKHVVDFDITSCYWLKMHDIINIVSRLINLTGLYACDTELDLLNAQLIMNAAPKLKRLSCSWSEGRFSCALEDVILWMSSFEFLYLHFVDDVSHRLVAKILASCNELKELWLVFTFCQSIDTEVADEVQNIQLPNLDKLVVLLSKNCMVIQNDFVESILRSVAVLPRNWKWFVLNHQYTHMTRLTTRFINTPVNNFKNVQRLSGYMPWNNQDNEKILKFPDLQALDVNIGENSSCTSDLDYSMFPNITQLSYYHFTRHLNLLGDVVLASHLQEFRLDVCALEHITTISQLSNLKYLSLTACILHYSVCSDDYLHNKRPRLLYPDALDEFYGFEKLTTSCPNLEELELRCCVCEYNMQERESDVKKWNMQCVSKLKKLKKFTLESFHIKSGSFLTQLAEFCEDLTQFNLKDMNLGGVFNYRKELLAALPHFKKLKDFRFEHADIGSVNNIIKALANCPFIERVLLKSTFEMVHSERETRNAILEFVNTARQLVYFHMHSPTLSERICSTIKQSLVPVLQSRPSLVVEIISDAITSDTPFIHFMEMCDPVSTVCMSPFRRPTFLSHRIA